MGNLKLNIANALGSTLKEALASDAKLLKNSLPFLSSTASTWSSIWEEQQKEEEEERLYRRELYHQDDDQIY